MMMNMTRLSFKRSIKHFHNVQKNICNLRGLSAACAPKVRTSVELLIPQQHLLCIVNITSASPFYTGCSGPCPEPQHSCNVKQDNRNAWVLETCPGDVLGKPVISYPLELKGLSPITLQSNICTLSFPGDRFIRNPD